MSVRGAILLSLCLCVQPLAAQTPAADRALALRLVNQHRAAHGVAAVRMDAGLSRASADQTAAMVRSGSMSHDAGGEFTARVRAASIRGPAAENIGYGYPTADLAVEAWKSSSGHNANLLNPAMGRIGLAGAPDASGRMYWTMILAR